MTVERGELFIYCTATLGPIIYLSNREIQDGSTFPGKLGLLILVIVMVAVCAIVFSLYRANVIHNQSLAFHLSWMAYVVALLLYYWTILYDGIRTTGAQAAFRRDTADFVGDFNERH